MFSVLPAKFGVPVADGVGVVDARGALQASVSASSGGSATGLPRSSVATKTRYAEATWTTLPVSMSSASTRTPISMLVFPTWFTDAFAVTRCPT